jgi:hypothetical protein
MCCRLSHVKAVAPITTCEHPCSGDNGLINHNTLLLTVHFRLSDVILSVLQILFWACELGDLGSISDRSPDILFSSPPRLAVESTQPPSQWVLGRFPWGQSCRIVNVVTRFPVPIYIYLWNLSSMSSLRLHSVALYGTFRFGSIFMYMTLVIYVCIYVISTHNTVYIYIQYMYKCIYS